MASSKQFQNSPSPWKQKIQAFRQNPSAISAMASLGFHGLLLIGLPLLPYTALKATEPEIQAPVELIELTPEEQKRLPDFSTLPPIELPKITNSPQLNQPDSDLFSFSTLPKPPSNTLPPLSGSSLFAPPPLPIFIPPAPPAPMPSFSIQIPTTPVQPTSPKPAAPPASPSPAATSPADSLSPQPDPNAAENAPEVAVESAPESPSAETTESPSPRSEDQIRQDLIAEQQTLRELYTYNPSGTTVNDANAAYLSLLDQRIEGSHANLEFKQDEVTVEYPRLACPLKDESRSAVVGVVVDAENNLIGEPQIIQSSGYQLFNQEAVKAMESYSFENSTGSPQPFLITVKFQYDESICPPGLAPLDPAS